LGKTREAAVSDTRHELAAIVDSTMPQTQIRRAITWLIVGANFLRGFACGFAVSLFCSVSAEVGKGGDTKAEREVLATTSRKEKL
jgi:hypothetical protein